MPERLTCFLDAETTGLKPESGDFLLEVGAVLVTPDLEVVDEIEIVIGAPAAGVERRLASDPSGWVRAIHTGNGLLAEVAASPISTARAEATLLDWLAKHGFDQPKSLGAMAGSTVHFDQRCLRIQMPTLLDRFGYQINDFSSTREQARLWRPDLTAGEPTPRALHRALPDVHDTLALARYYQSALFGADIDRRPLREIRETCGLCNGVGHQDGAHCPDCHGIGKIRVLVRGGAA